MAKTHCEAQRHLCHFIPGALEKKLLNALRPSKSKLPHDYVTPTTEHTRLRWKSAGVSEPYKTGMFELFKLLIFSMKSVRSKNNYLIN